MTIVETYKALEIKVSINKMHKFERRGFDDFFYQMIKGKAVYIVETCFSAN